MTMSHVNTLFLAQPDLGILLLLLLLLLLLFKPEFPVGFYGRHPRIRIKKSPSSFYCFIFFKVRKRSTFSESHPQEMGVPRSTIMLAISFSAKINSITQYLKLLLVARHMSMIFRFATDRPPCALLNVWCSFI